MEDSPTIALFEQHRIRQVWYEDEWWFSVIDVVAVLTGSKNPGSYWYVLKSRLRDEGAGEVLTFCKNLKLPGRDGKLYPTDCATSETLLRLIQSVPSPNAEPFKRWLAQVGQERLEEIDDPENAYVEWRRRLILSFQAQGYSAEWAENRVDSIVARKALTHEWSVRDIQDHEIPILTDQLHMGTFGLSISSHKGLKNFKVVRRGMRSVYQGDLRPAMTAMELAVSTFSENVSRALHVERDSHGFAEVARDVDDAGTLASEQRRRIEELTGKPVVSPQNLVNEPDGGLWGRLPPAP